MTKSEVDHLEIPHTDQ
ncbi:unnamed protein product [Linum tenue]|uniref:Uncharacterized protein n=1 Tax=Linum tenue TaxID=586396 RepID=A0AAV0NTY0_9ROSI|nr:unnamed protein product [Linum tenue]